MNEEMAWVAQAQQGSDEAFTHLVEAYQTHVYNLCYRMLGESEAAEDALAGDLPARLPAHPPL